MHALQLFLDSVGKEISTALQQFGKLLTAMVYFVELQTAEREAYDCQVAVHSMWLHI